MKENHDLLLGDGLSKFIEWNRMDAERPEEMTAEQKLFKEYDFSTDIFSIGCIMYELCSLTPPFEDKQDQGMCNDYHVQMAIWVDNSYTPAYKRVPANYSEELFQIITRMLSENRRERPSA